MREFIFEYKNEPKLGDFYAAIEAHLETPDFTIAKNQPHHFVWEIWPKEGTIKQLKKKKEVEIDVLQADLRTKPFLLKDGDILSFRLNSKWSAEEIAKDDFQTDEDIRAAEMLALVEKIPEEKKKKNKEEPVLSLDVGF